MPDFSLEQDLGSPGTIVCGIDEAGRGPWAGPVVAAAVVLDPETLSNDLRHRLDDSKALKPAVREELCRLLLDTQRVGIGAASADEIDRINVLAATMRAMQRAVAALGPCPHLALVDGNRAPDLPCRVETVVKGDARSLSIAAASIVAKVTRDRAMAALARRYPEYGWETNAGYGTRAHQSGLVTSGVTPHHRKTFAPILKILSPAQS